MIETDRQHAFTRKANPLRIVIYDGICIFCNGAANFIARRDKHNRYRFTPLQSDLAQSLIKHYRLSNVGIDTFLLIKDGQCHIWTDAAFEIASELSGPWRLAAVLKVIPRPLRDALYRGFARNRLRLFGRTATCPLPTPDILDKFIGIPRGNDS